MNHDEYPTKGEEIKLRASQSDNDNDIRPEDEEQEIDLLELAMKLWQQRKKIGIWCAIGAVLGLVVAFSIPREYETSVKLVPEIAGNQKISGSYGAIAAMVGLGGGGQSGSDAVNPQLYPDVLNSTPFLVGLFDVPVEDKKKDINTTVRDYVEEDIKSPWWSAIMALPFKLLGAIRGGGDEEPAKDKKIDTFQLTPEEFSVVQALSRRITGTVDTKTSVITITVKMQNPMISATLADTVVDRLRDYITDYRTNKARKDLSYAEMLNREAKDKYYEAQQKLADFQDRNQGLVLHSAQTTRERLENEATLAFNLYNQTSQQVQLAKAKVQENTPVYTTLAPASVPLRPASPKKPMILIGFVFLAFVACSAWILYGKPLVEEMKNKKLENEEHK